MITKDNQGEPRGTKRNQEEPREPARTFRNYGELHGNRWKDLEEYIWKCARFYAMRKDFLEAPYPIFLKVKSVSFST